jgi:hypothetical protein
MEKMMNLAPYIERSLVDNMLPPVIVPDSVSVTVLTDSTMTQQELAYVELFNAGLNNVYYAYGRDCDATTSFNAYMVPGQMLRVPVRQKVCMFSIGGTTIGRTIIRRSDTINTTAQ